MECIINCSYCRKGVLDSKFFYQHWSASKFAALDFINPGRTVLCPVLLKGVTYSLNHISPTMNFLWFLQIPSNLQEAVNKGTWQHLRVSSCPMYMHVCVYIHMHIYINASYTFIYTCKHTNRLHPNIFSSKLICHVIYKENTKKWMVFIFTNKIHSQTHMDFFWHSLGISTLLWELVFLLLNSGNTFH